MIIKLKCRIKPTESPEKIMEGIKKIFTDAKLLIDGNHIIGESTNIDRFKELLRSQAILDTGRMVMENGINGKSTTFKINKQAAYAGMLNFDEDVHGGITVKIICEEDDDIMDKIKDIAPRTKNGKIIEENEINE